MSLFKAREWWAVTCGSTETLFSERGLCAFPIVVDQKGKYVIVVGGFDGNLRLYLPTLTKDDCGRWSAYNPNELLLETNVGDPVLQVEVGKFIAGSDKHGLAVLLPRKLVVFSLQINTGQASHGTQYQLTPVHEHKLPRSACSFCSGSFGGVKGKDFICVQSLDCTLTVIEQESVAFSRFLPNSLIPGLFWGIGPLVYLPNSDSLITVSSTRHVESYKYQVLAVAASAQSREEAAGAMTGKRVAAKWSVSFGEDALDVLVFGAPSSTQHILILGERSMLCLNDQGQMHFTYKFDYVPSCAYSLGLGANCSNRDTKGVIVALTDAGRLSCNYLGTDASTFIASQGVHDAGRNVDYDQIDREMKDLQRVIRERSKTDEGIALPSAGSSEAAAASDAVSLVYHVSPVEEGTQSYAPDIPGEEERIPSITLQVTAKPSRTITNVSIAISTPPPIQSVPRQANIDSLSKGGGGDRDFRVFMADRSPLFESHVVIILTYTSSTGALMVQRKTVSLPSRLLMFQTLPEKSAAVKMTIESNQPAVDLTQIFPEFATEQASSSALALRPCGGAVVSILTSKAQRYRVQCDNLSDCWIVLDQLFARIRAHFGKSGGVVLGCSEGLPLDPYFELIDSLLTLRNEERSAYARLEAKAGELRAIQRLLLTKLKDKSPNLLANLDALLNSSHEQILKLTDEVRSIEDERRLTERRVAAATRVLLLLAQIWANLSKDEYEQLSGALHYDCASAHLEDSCWPERTESALSFLLSTSLSKSAKDHVVSSPHLAKLEDAGVLCKRIAAVLEKLGKGMPLHKPEVKAQRTLPSIAPNSQNKAMLSRLSTNPSIVIDAVSDEDTAGGGGGLGGDGSEADDTLLPESSKFTGRHSPKAPIGEMQDSSIDGIFPAGAGNKFKKPRPTNKVGTPNPRTSDPRESVFVDDDLVL